MIAISPYKSFYKAAACISFDYETSAIEHYYTYRTIRKIILLVANRFFDTGRAVGEGQSNREAAEKILKALQSRNVHATWNRRISARPRTSSRC